MRGAAASLEVFCVVFQDCRVALRGVELSVWDVLLVKDGGAEDLRRVISGDFKRFWARCPSFSSFLLQI